MSQQFISASAADSFNLIFFKIDFYNLLHAIFLQFFFFKLSLLTPAFHSLSCCERRTAIFHSI